MFKRSSKGSFNRTEQFLKNLSKENLAATEYDVIRQYADDLVSALESATPKDTGRTSKSWRYEIVNNKNKVQLQVFNDNVNDGVCIAILLQYGHATKSGSFVRGIDYINPAVKPYFDKIEESVWREVTA